MSFILALNPISYQLSMNSEKFCKFSDCFNDFYDSSMHLCIFVKSAKSCSAFCQRSRWSWTLLRAVIAHNASSSAKIIKLNRISRFTQFIWIILPKPTNKWHWSAFNLEWSMYANVHTICWNCSRCAGFMELIVEYGPMSLILFSNRQNCLISGAVSPNDLVKVSPFLLDKNETGHTHTQTYPLLQFISA